MKKLFLIISVLFTISNFSIAQSGADLITIKGLVIDSDENAPLPSAHIKIEGSNIGTVSNLDGEFELKIPADKKSGKLIVSFIGYDSFEAVISGISLNSLKVNLKPQQITLDELVINSKKSELSIIEEAIRAIPKNHGRNAVNFSAFLRDYARQDGKPFQINEGIYDIYMGATTDKKPLKQAKMVQARFATDRATNQRNRKAFEIGISFRFSSSLKEILDKDMVNNVEESFLLSKKNLKLYDFKLKGVVGYEGNKAYLIQFTPKQGLKKHLFEGKIYLDVNSLAFIRIEAYSKPELIKYKKIANKLIVALAGLQESFFKDQSFIFNYKKIGDKWYFNNSYETGQVQLVKSKNYFNETMSFNSEYVVTDFQLENTKPFKEEEIVTDKEMQNKKYGEYNEKFWADYNVIKLDKNSRVAYEKIIKRNEDFSVKCSKEALNTNIKKKRLISQKKLKMVDSVFAAFDNQNTPGIALGIIQDGDLVYNKGFGMADINNNIKITSQSLFKIASASKQFTAASILLLEEQEKLSLDDDIRKHLPELPNYKEKITIKNLLNHSSGLKEVFFQKLMTYIQSKNWSEFSDELVLKELIKEGDALNYKPGTQSKVNSTDYCLLKIIVERVSEQKFSQYVNENIFVPLEMKDSYIGEGALVKTNKHAIGYESVNNYSADLNNSVTTISNESPSNNSSFSKYFWSPNTFGSDGVVTSIDDLIKWDQNFYDNELGEEEDELIHKMKRMTAQIGAGTEYGLGLEITKHRCQELEITGGSGPVFSSEIWRFPNLELTIICLSNSQNTVLNTKQKVRLVADILMEGE